MNENKKKTIVITISIIACITIITIISIILINNKPSGNKLMNKNENKGETETEAGEENSKYPTYVTEIEDGVKLNQSTKLTDERQFGNYTISNLQLTEKSGMTTLLANVKNNSSDKTELKIVEITLLDEKGESLITLTGIIEPLEPGGTSQLNTAVTSGYVQAYDYTIKEK